MEHCKKLVLVPHETLNRLHDKPVLRTQSDVLGELDSEMQKILLQKSEDSEKWKLYQQTLQRYLHFVNEQRKPLEISIANQTDQSHQDHTRFLSQLTTVTPKKFQHHAKALFHSLAQSNAIVSWDELGQLRIDDTPLPQSHIVELISDAVRTRKIAKARGWKSFATVLKRINVPLDLISNTQYRDQILSQRGSGVVAERGVVRAVPLDAPLRRKLIKQPNRSPRRWSPWSY